MLYGKPVAIAAMPLIAERALRLTEADVKPCLATLRVGERPDDVAYENSIAVCGASVGVSLRRNALPIGADVATVADAVRSLAADPEVHGILVFRPLPDEAREAAALAAVPTAKDIDGVTYAQMAGLYAMKECGEVFFPCTAEAVIRLMDHYGIPITGKRAVVIGRSAVVGKPSAHLLLARDATVTVCHRKTPDLAERVRGADILVCAAGLAREGRAHMLGSDYFAPGQVIIDAAVNGDDEGIYGDVDMNAVEGVVSAVTPVPGGLGAVTTLVLVEHVIRAAEMVVRL
jgi:methylenetetrahydrofolate dehydrogenase (NADP+)/methenyltetrahydrofolate cyclohydrolase